MLSREHRLGAAPRVETPGPDLSPEGVRDDPRVPFLGYPFELRAGRITSSIRMKDLSCGGASGLCDEPLDIGAFVTIHFSKEHVIEAEVRWIRLMYVGLKFTNPLAPAFVRRLHQAHGAFVTTRSKK
jgi:hypothetical protein